MKQLSIFILLAGSLAGCLGGGSHAPEPVVYLLRADVKLPDGPQTSPVEVGISRVSVADYLGQSGIVVVSSGNQLRVARQHRWAEPLDSSIRLFLHDAISAERGYLIHGDTAKRLSWKYQLEIRIDEWHGSLDGDVKLVAFWAIINTSDETVVARHRLERTAGLAEDGYAALVESQTKLLYELADAISASLDGIN